MPRGNTVNSAMYADLLKNHLHPAIKSKRCGLLSTGVLLQRDNARPNTARSTVATIPDLQVSTTSAVLAPPVTFMSLDRSKRRWEASLSGPTQRCSRRCMSGWLSAKRLFFLEVSMHFRSAGTLVWYAMETT